MAKSKKYAEIFKEITKRFKSKDDVDFIKEKFSELLEETTKENTKAIANLENKQKKLEKDFIQLKGVVTVMEEEMIFRAGDEDDDFDDVESGTYVDDDENDDSDTSYKFSVTCPYCGVTFYAGKEFKTLKSIECPDCNRKIELDWTVDNKLEKENGEYEKEDEESSEDLSEVAEKKSTFKNENKKNSKEKNNKKQNNEDDM